MPITRLPVAHCAGNTTLRCEPETDLVGVRRAGMGLEPYSASMPGVEDTPACRIDPLAHADLVGDPYAGAIAQGRTMRAGGSTDRVSFVGDRVEAYAIVTTLSAHDRRIGRRMTVIFLGLNNADDTAADIALGIKAVLDRVRGLFRATRVILASVLPSKHDNAKIAEVNRAIAAGDDGRSRRAAARSCRVVSDRDGRQFIHRRIPTGY